MHFKFRNVNDAFRTLVSGIHSGEIPTRRSPSRNGDVLRVVEPVLIEYAKPRERVLFNRARDVNPFFHLYEALWMLAGRNDVESVAYYASNMRNYSDDGKTLHGAYGYRWRNWFGYDQLEEIVEELRDNPASRRCLLQMWDAGPTKSDLLIAKRGGKDVPCNTQAYFDIRTEKGHRPADRGMDEGSTRNYLDMTVCNRSNDMIWGTLGANVVHCAFLQEYLARRIGVELGRYHQFTNNLHVYTNNWEPEKWLEDQEPDWYRRTIEPRAMDCVEAEVRGFVQQHGKDSLARKSYESLFLLEVAQPMSVAFHLHKRRQYTDAINEATQIRAKDWGYAAVNWLSKRQKGWERKQKEVVK